MFYDATNDSFIGFASPLIEGLPIVNHFQTDKFSDLQTWFNDYEKSKLMNCHLLEPLMRTSNEQVHSRPYILAAYGTDNRFTAIDIIRRWCFMCNRCREEGIRLVGFSTDSDPRYLKAMRLSLEFFARLPNINLLDHQENLFVINYPKTWNFFFMRSKQPYLCMQDGVHLATKIRNRFLSNKITMLMGKEYVSVTHVENLIENYSRIDHNLYKSDVFPNDRQNFTSCLKISTDDVLELLENANNIATHTYLYLLKLSIQAYVSKDVHISDRLYFGWVLTFFCRMWW